MMQMDSLKNYQDNENIYENSNYSCQKNNGAEQRAPQPPASPDNKHRLFKLLLLLLCAVLIAAIISLTMYHFIKINRKEQDLEELKNTNHSTYSSLLGAHATLQSQYRTLNEKYDESSKELRNLKEYYCYVISLSWISFSTEKTCPVCKVGWVPFNSKCYFFSTDKLTWESSRDQCVRKGGQLVIVKSSKEQEFLENKISVMGGEEKGYWIGLHDRFKDGEFVWVDGTPLSTSNRFWDVNQPNGGNNENCVQIWIESQWKHWHDFPCATPSKWVCETTSSLLPI